MKNILSFIIALAFSCGIASAQDRTITGRVADKNGEKPLKGATILADKTKIAATTGEDGMYSITIPAATTTLVISYVGYGSQTLSIGTRKVINASLTATGDLMNEVVVIGYGSVKKNSVTGAVSRYKNEKLDEVPVSRLDQALQGKIAGVQIQNVTSEAGSDPKIRIRGVNSVNAGANPLVVVDGHPVPDGLQYVNMADVETVDVLKDAASAAIYGSRGASGVILITTKSGKVDKTKFGVKLSSGFKTQYELYPMMTTSEYTNLLYYEGSLRAMDPQWDYRYTGQLPTAVVNTNLITTNEKAAYIIENTLLGGQGENWQEAALRNALVRNVQMNVSGGKKEVKYFISGAAQKDQGMMYHSEYDKYSIRGKVDLQLSKKMKATFNFNPTYIRRERPSTNFIDFVRFQSFLPVYHTAATAAFVAQTPQWSSIRAGDFAQARHFNNRAYSGYMPDGTLYNSGTTVLSPFNTNNNTPKSIMETRTIKTNDYRVTTSGDLTYTIIPGLEAKTLASVYAASLGTVDWTNRNSSKDGEINKGVFKDSTYIDLLSENTVNYTKQIKKHSINAVTGFTVQKTRIKSHQTTGLDFPSDNIKSLNTALQIDQANVNTYTLDYQEGLISFLGRVVYSYDSKYLFTASFRRDGSSKFGPGYRWGNFPAASAGWVVSQEKFMENVKFVNNLKLRGSYGVSGNNNIPPYQYLDLLYGANYPIGSGTGASNGGQSTASNAVLSNPTLTWERTFQFNAGIDASLFKNAVSFSLDVYNSKSDSLLLRQTSLGVTGFSQAWKNIGRVQNKGVEFEVTTNNFRKTNFKWTTTANIAHNKNKILDLSGEQFYLNYGERSETYRNLIGAPLIEFFGYKTDGVWLSVEQIKAATDAGLKSSLSGLFTPGGLKLVDVNGDNVIDEADRVSLGNPYPDFTWGVTNNITFKAVDLTFSFQGSQGGQLINGDINYNETRRYNKNYTENRWISPANPGDGKTPYSTVGFNPMFTDYVVEDASYYALREVVVGYTFPKTLAKTLHLSNVRAYFSAQNLYFHSAAGYRGINPEARLSSGPYNTALIDGYQRGGYPMPKTFLFGIDLNF